MLRPSCPSVKKGATVRPSFVPEATTRVQAISSALFCTYTSGKAGYWPSCHAISRCDWSRSGRIVRPSSSSTHIFPGCCLTSSTARSESASVVPSNCSARETGSWPARSRTGRTSRGGGRACRRATRCPATSLSRTRTVAETELRLRTSARSRRSTRSPSTRRLARRPRSEARSRSRRRATGGPRGDGRSFRGRARIPSARARARPQWARELLSR